MIITKSVLASVKDVLRDYDALYAYLEREFRMLYGDDPELKLFIEHAYKALQAGRQWNISFNGRKYTYELQKEN